jgi:hypothetical protein
VSYCTEEPLVVLAYKNNHDAAITVPVGKNIEILGPDGDDRFLVVTVDGEEFLVFETDLAAATTH